MSVGKFGIRYRFRLGAAHPPCHLKGKQDPLETFAFGSILITWPRKDLSLPVYCYIKAFRRDVRLDAVDKWIGSR